MSEANGCTWHNISRLEPKLAELLKEAQAVTDPGGDPGFCANAVWYDRFKPQLTCLVGWFARCKHFLLTSPEAYDIAYDKIYEALPDCRGCCCL
jgi:hypothetical protein